MDLKELKIAKTFRLTKKLGSGAFGEIYHATNLTNNMEVALKLGFILILEAVNTRNPQLFFEAKLYKYLLQDN